MALEQHLQKIAHEAYFLNPDMVKFLLIENLALKTLLHDKGLFTSEEYKEAQVKAAEILEARTKEQLKEHVKRLMDSGK
jgi:hypothetical protein